MIFLVFSLVYHFTSLNGQKIMLMTIHFNSSVKPFHKKKKTTKILSNKYKNLSN